MNKLFESAPSINNSEDYWVKKGKEGKKCMIYFHDDLDGIMSAIVMRQYLQNKEFDIMGYGIVNYQEGWSNIKFNDSYINISVDYAEDNEDLDIYIDHHGKFVEKGGEIEKLSVKSTKTPTTNAYEGICDQLGVATDSLILNVIDMIDAAKYEFYGVDIETILNFNLQDIKNSNNPKMVFAGAFNQLMKRGDYKTLIEVAHNSSLSIYSIYLMFKMLYPANNLDRRTSDEKDFILDGRERILKMEGRVRGKGDKKIYTSQNDFYEEKWNGKTINRDGYVIIGKLVFVPNGTWANALRARAIISADLRENPDLEGHNIYFVLLQYGGSLQVADTIGMKNIPEEDLPVLRTGEVIEDLGTYTHDLLDSFKKNLHYKKELTKAGGHKGIGNISNIVGIDNDDIKWVDIFKNKIINDLSGVNWSIDMPWDVYKESVERKKPVNGKILLIDQIRKV